MRGRGPRVLWLAGVLTLAASGALAADESGDGSVPPKTEAGIGVAPFERMAPPGASVPDVATLLADRLATRGVERIVGPADLGARAAAEPSAQEVREWASQHRVGALVVGKTTRLGQRLSIDVRLRSGQSGAVVGTYVEEVARPADLGTALERLSSQVLEGAGRGQGGTTEAAQADEPSVSAGPKPFQSDAPIKISSAQLEAFEKEGRKRLVFTRDVRASQDDLVLRAERLEAFYPANSSQPDRLVATGNVTVRQQNRTARCERATYFRDDQRVVCTGQDAVLTQDDDQVQGKEIIFKLDTEVLTVTGGAHVRIHPDGEGWSSRRDQGTVE